MTVQASYPGAGAGLCWPPVGVGDFADVAWFLAGVLGNAAGVAGLEVYRHEDHLYASVSAESREIVEQLGARPGWELWGSPGGQASASGVEGGVRVRASWSSRDYADAVRAGTAAPPARVTIPVAGGVTP